MVELDPPSESQPEPDLSNRQIGNYQIARRLGRGGMADVYLAEQISLKRQIALKVLHRNLAGDSSYVRRFHNEAQAAAALIHTNIVQIHEVGCVDGVHFIAQEFVDGQNLKQFVARRGPLDARQTISVMRQVAAALQRAGQRGIIHRDIKPENIMLTSSGEVKVADFGLARASSAGSRLDLTQDGMTMGTPLYMSPEQVEGRVLDSRSDLYSFGVTCYEMLTGRPPFEADNPITVAVHHLKTDPPRLETLRKDIPGGLCRIVHQLLAKSPEDRYATAADVLRDLRTIVVEGAEEWSLGDEDWVDEKWETEAVRRIAATQQLATVMLHEKRLPKLSRWLLGLGVVTAMAVAVGSGLAWTIRPTSLLEFNPDSLPVVPIKESAQAQFLAAVEYETERGWKAVAELFPPDDAHPENAEYIRKANLQLAYLYDREDRTDEAIALLTMLESDESNAMVQKSALALLANIRERRKERRLANEAVAKLAQIIAKSPQVDNELRDHRQQLESLHLQQLLEEHVKKPPVEPNGKG
jgi:tRNA A-37 threonylcarbamoyl transferase component Bud32